MQEPLKIVLIDDDEDLVDSVRSFLERRSYSVSTALEGHKGLEVIKSRKPELIILDINMSDMDGIQVLMQIRGDRDIKDIPVIMLTAKDTQLDRINALEMGAYEYITKPLDLQALLRQVENVLRKKKEGQV